jgi:pre-mRNA-processing factor SLU7
MASASERRAQRELAEARQSGNAPPEIDVKSGAMINPHNPEFITKKPWYLAEGTGGDGGPTLDHQADQQDRRTISLAEADALVREERERIKEKLRKQRTKLKKSGRIGGDDDDDDDLFEVGMWIEALKKNKRPYLIAQIIKAASDKKGRFYDLQYEDGYIERSVRPFGNSGGRDNVAQRMRVTKSGSRATTTTTAGKESYDSKRDAYHGVEIDNHTKKMEERYREREALRKEQRQKEREREKAEKEQRRKEMEDAKARGDIEGEALLAGGGGNASANENDAAENNSADSDSDSDSDAGNASDNDDGFSSDDEIVDKDGKLFESRLARQGGVGGAQMKVTARNLRIREDTAKYLRNLDPNSAYYDPKSRSMRDNPYASADAAGDADDAAVARQAEMRGFAGDNFARISGDAVGLAVTQLFAWDAEKKLGVEGANVHVQADPSRAELMRRKVESRGMDMKEKKRRAILDRYGGEEYLDDAGIGNGSLSASLSTKGREDVAPKETPEERSTRFGVSHVEQEYGRDGRLATSGSGSNQKMKRVPIPCKYEEDVYANGHTAVWGSYFHKGAFRWGYADDHSLIRSSYGTGRNGQIANDESNELQYGSGAAGSAMLASARKMLEVIPKAALNGNGDDKFKPNQQSKLYGEVVDKHKEFDKEKLQEAMRRQQQQEKVIVNDGKNKRKYNSLHAEVDVTEEDMEAYRISKGRGVEDPMAKLGEEELLDYNK